MDKTTGAQFGAEISAIGGNAGFSLSLAFTHATSSGLNYNYGPFTRLRTIQGSNNSIYSHFGAPLTAGDRDLPANASNDVDQCLFVKGVIVGMLTREEKKKYQRVKQSTSSSSDKENSGSVTSGKASLAKAR
jgi:hypothetical protein